MEEANPGGDNTTHTERKSSIRGFLRSNRTGSEDMDKSKGTIVTQQEGETSSVFSRNSISSRIPLFGRKLSVAEQEAKDAKKAEKKANKRESISERGAFRIETDPVTGLSRAVENTDWPPGVNYKETSTQKILRTGGLGEWYEGRGAFVAGGDGAANAGPDPEWIPGLTADQKKKEKDDQKKGGYVF